MGMKLTLNSQVCPHCDTSLIGEPIPEKDREAFGGATHFQRQIAVEILGEDRVSYVRCPDCGAEDQR